MGDSLRGRRWGNASTDPANDSRNCAFLGAARLTVFLVLALVVAFSAPAVRADGEVPPSGEGGAVATDPSGAGASDSTGTDPIPTSATPTTTTETPVGSETTGSTSEPADISTDPVVLEPKRR